MSQDLPRRPRAFWPVTLLAYAVVGGTLAMLIERPKPAVEAQPQQPRGTTMIEETSDKIVIASKWTLQYDADKLLADVPAPRDLHDELRRAVLVREAKGTDAALAYFGTLDVSESPVGQVLGRVLAGEASLGDDDRALLASELGFMGRLAAHPESEPISAERQTLLDQATRTLLVSLAATVMLTVGAFAGAVGLVVLYGLWRAGKLESRLGPPIAYHGIYMETFALWPLVYFGLGLGLQQMPVSPLVVNVLAMLLSLGTLAWPIVRGVPLTQVCHDIGWTLGKNPLLEVVLGVAGYFLMLPILVLLMGVVMVYARTGQPMPTHPIAESLAHPTTPLLWQVYLFGAVVAPLVEETMFRGVFYRHLREMSRGLRAFWSFVIAALINGAVFGLVHPQGLLGAPLLAAIAFPLVLLREWRGTLLPSMIAHGLNNFCMFTLALFLFR